MAGRFLSSSFTLSSVALSIDALRASSPKVVVSAPRKGSQSCGSLVLDLLRKNSWYPCTYGVGLVSMRGGEPLREKDPREILNHLHVKSGFLGEQRTGLSPSESSLSGHAKAEEAFE